MALRTAASAFAACVGAGCEHAHGVSSARAQPLTVGTDRLLRLLDERLQLLDELLDVRLQRLEARLKLVDASLANILRMNLLVVSAVQCCDGCARAAGPKPARVAGNGRAGRAQAAVRVPQCRSGLGFLPASPGCTLLTSETGDMMSEMKSREAVVEDGGGGKQSSAQHQRLAGRTRCDARPN